MHWEDESLVRSKKPRLGMLPSIAQLLDTTAHIICFERDILSKDPYSDSVINLQGILNAGTQTACLLEEGEACFLTSIQLLRTRI